MPATSTDTRPNGNASLTEEAAVTAQTIDLATDQKPHLPQPAKADRRNSFDAIRMFAAFCVFYSHELGMAGYLEPPLGPLGITLSSTGLYIFFGLSGYLVALSLARDPRILRFSAARLLRIYPAWIVNMLFCVVLGSVVTSLSQMDFWSDAQTHSFLVHDLPIVTTPTQFQLPGVLADARWPVINGSIWTVKYELLCYALLLVLHRLTPLRLLGRPAVPAIAAALFAGAYIHHISTTPNPDPAVFFSRYNSFNLLRFFMTFLAGATYAASEPLTERVRLIFLLVPAGLITFGPSPAFGRAGIILLLTLSVIELGKTRWLYSRTYRRIGDLSYGTFLYAYPIQNLVTTRLFDGHNFHLVVALSAAGTLACALMSWRLVEQPALSVLRRLDRSTPQLAGAGEAI
ncbi:acyltransferase family protein [Lichenifustis flavocetrariae]|uniref:Acyltransferase n=1 Tax=Lichenifustis flavocetrariae TaxID=2949735 RepID=A0AA42CLB4_9HYPH|nr:acyltransferase [Lichenifustis flavocetrariae]MCW6511434.1 acyltransferase [Lichenifustis flavocetrariae]